MHLQESNLVQIPSFLRLIRCKSYKILLPFPSLPHFLFFSLLIQFFSTNPFLISHGYPVVVTDRGSLANTLLSGLNDPDNHVFTGKQLKNIIPQEDSVMAEFSDGTSYNGSIVIGADGIWSTVRDQIRQHAPSGLFLKNPYEASYKGIFGRGPLVDGITSGQGIEVHGDGWLIQAFPSQKETHMFIYKRIPPTTTKIPFSSVVTESDIAEFYDAQLTPQVSFKEIWDKRYAQGTANYEEGIAQLWHHNRIALVGDAVHKASILPHLLLLFILPLSLLLSPAS